MEDFGGATGAADAFSRFWLDLISQAAAGGARSQQPTMPEQMLRQMRQAFFDAWAKQCEEFMRSEAFLEAMKKGMDNALAFKQQVNEFITKTLHDNQIPARSDTDSILLVLRSLEERVLDRIDRLSDRVTRLEHQTGGEKPPAASTSERRETAGNTRPKTKGTAR